MVIVTGSTDITGVSLVFPVLVVNIATPFMIYRQGIVPDDIVNDLGSRLTSDWYKLGIELSIDTKLLDKLRSQGRIDGWIWPFRMLLEWKAHGKHLTKDAQMRELICALDRINRNDLVEYVRIAIEDEGANLDDRLLMHVGEAATADWYMLGIQLGLSTLQLDKIKMEALPTQNLDPGVEMLRLFRNKDSSIGLVEELKEALCSIRRLDLARFLDEKIRLASQRSGPLIQTTSHFGKEHLSSSTLTGDLEAVKSTTNRSRHSASFDEVLVEKSSLPSATSRIHSYTSSLQRENTQSATFNPQSTSYTSVGILSPTSEMCPSVSQNPSISMRSYLDTAAFAPSGSSWRSSKET